MEFWLVRRVSELNCLSQKRDTDSEIVKEERLKLWADAQQKKSLLAWLIPRYRQTLLPHVEELKSLARHYYPPRSELKCHVCDFGEGRAEHKVVDLGELEEYWQEKPAWVDVRWIHAPLGLGLTHSSVEDIYLRTFIFQDDVLFLALTMSHQTFLGSTRHVLISNR